MTYAPLTLETKLIAHKLLRQYGYTDVEINRALGTRVLDVRARDIRADRRDKHVKAAT